MGAMRCSRRLPEELFILIVEHVTDRKTLRSLMLVCRSLHTYAEKVCYKTLFSSHGLAWIFNLLWPSGDSFKASPVDQNAERALAVLERSSRYCCPKDYPPFEVSTTSLPYFTSHDAFPADDYTVGKRHFGGRLTFLHLAAHSNLSRIVGFLIKNGVEINPVPEESTGRPEDDAHTHFNLRYSTPLFLASVNKSVDSARVLLNGRANIGESWRASLQSASGDLVSLFLKFNPALLLEPIDGLAANGTRSPLAFALDCSVQDPSPVVETLISHGANTSWIEYVYRVRGSCVGWALERSWLHLAVFFAKTYGRQQDAYDAFRLDDGLDEHMLRMRIEVVEALISRGVQVIPGWRAYFPELPVAASGP